LQTCRRQGTRSWPTVRGFAVVVVDRVLRTEDLAQPVIPPLAGDEEDLLPIWRLEGIELRPVRQGR